jgi:2-keto-3-deoxy-L-rhamnonate aldolase RhmA
MKLFFITNNPGLASFVVANGVDRIFVDLEINGKVERQGHLSTVISRHAITDIHRVRSAVPEAEILVRVNPVHDGLKEEIDQVVAAGADIIMLPMFRSPNEVRAFIGMVSGRARVSLLVETVGAMETLSETASLSGVDEVHIGLNDLHLELKNNFMFEPLANGLVDEMAAVLQKANIPFGVGGIARVGEGILPAELLISEHVRLGSSAAILSRTFHRQIASAEEIAAKMNFADEVSKIRTAVRRAREMTAALLHENRCEVQRRVADVVSDKAPSAV